MSEEWNEVLQRLTRVETKLDHVITDQESRILLVERNVDRVFLDMDKRISKIEEAQTWLMRGVLGALFTAVIALLGMIIK